MRKIFLMFVSGLMLFVPEAGFAYNAVTTHAALSDEIVDFYNLEHPDAQITPEEKEWIVQGSIDEDTPPRWVNHFYDPVHNISWTGANTFAEVAAVRDDIAPDPPMTAVEWVDVDADPAHPFVQKIDYARYGGDWTWSTGIKAYARNNDEKTAFLALGHALHLIEDMTVPEHT